MVGVGDADADWVPDGDGLADAEDGLEDAEGGLADSDDGLEDADALELEDSVEDCDGDADSGGGDSEEDEDGDPDSGGGDPDCGGGDWDSVGIGGGGGVSGAFEKIRMAMRMAVAASRTMSSQDAKILNRPPRSRRPGQGRGHTRVSPGATRSDQWRR